MSPAPVILGGLAVLGLVVSLLTSYGNRKTTPYFVQFVALVSWLGPFCVPFLLSLDISATVYDKCYSSSSECVRRVPFAYVSQDSLHGMWSAIYWSAFCVTWGTIPVLQAYISSGGFDFRSKLRDALRANLVYYLAAGLAGGFVLVYIAVKKQIDTTAALRAVVMAASNAWGLTLIVLFLGYGLVAIPRELWQSADTWWCLRRAEFRAAELQDDAVDADAELYEILQELSVVDRKVGRAHPLRSTVDILLNARPHPDINPSPLRHLPLSDGDGVDTSDPVTLKYLTKLHVRLKFAIWKRDRDNCIWRNLCKDAFLLQDIANSTQNADRKFHRTMRMTSGGRMAEMRMSLEWWWYIVLRPLLRRLLAVCSGIMSLAVLWSELTFNVKRPKLSLVSLAMKNTESYSWLETVSFLTVTYMCLCSYTTLMRLKVFSLYELVPDRHTDPASLLFVGSYLCRLTIPLCYNFLNLAAEEVDTVFSKIMGHIDLVPLFGSSFNDWFPIVLLVPVLLTVFNVYDRVLHVFGVRQLLSEDNEEVCADIEEGRRVLENARMLEERRVESGRLSAGASGRAASSQRGRRAVIGSRDRRAEESGWDGASLPRRTDLVESLISVRRRSSMDDPHAPSAHSPWTVKRLFSMVWGDRSGSSWRQLPEDEPFGPAASGEDQQLFTGDSATWARSDESEAGEGRVLGSGSQPLAGIDVELAHSRSAPRIGSAPRPMNGAGSPAQRPDSRASGRVFGRSPARAGAARKQPPEDIFGGL